MYSEITTNKKQEKRLLDLSIDNNVCKVSKASTEIMLDRFSNGKEIEFPFSK